MRRELGVIVVFSCVEMLSEAVSTGDGVGLSPDSAGYIGCAMETALGATNGCWCSRTERRPGSEVDVQLDGPAPMWKLKFTWSPTKCMWPGSYFPSRMTISVGEGSSTWFMGIELNQRKV